MKRRRRQTIKKRARSGVDRSGETHAGFYNAFKDSPKPRTYTRFSLLLTIAVIGIASIKLTKKVEKTLW